MRRWLFNGIGGRWSVQPGNLSVQGADLVNKKGLRVVATLYHVSNERSLELLYDVGDRQDESGVSGARKA